jgi:2-haloacid dehalogenase
MEIPEVIIFDVNETLLNMNPLKKSINSALQREYAADVWFAELLHYSLVDTVRDIYNDFSEIAEAVFKMNAKKYNLSFKDSEVSEVLSQVKKLEAYHDVIPALTELRSKGIKLVAFSNGKPEVLQDQLKYAGIDKYFYRIMSIEGCNKYKPHPAAYKYALQQLKSPAGKTMMIACH